MFNGKFNRIFWNRLSIPVLLLSIACAEQNTSAGSSTGYMGAQYQEAHRVELEYTQHAVQVCADGPTTFGIDVSRWQSTIDWDQVATDGVKYAIIRVANGTSALDQEFIANWTNAKRVGILRGSYQYFRPAQDPIAQAQHFVNALREQGDIGELPPVIDVEETDNESPSVIRNGVRAWIDYVEAELNVRPMIYSGRYFWGPNVCGGDLNTCSSFAQYPLWHPQYGNNPVDPPQNVNGRTCPNISDTWQRWDFWQYGSQGRIAGIGNRQSNVDMNVFNGTYEDLLIFAALHGGGMWEPPPIWKGRPRGQTFPLAADDPILLCIGERMSGEIYIDNEGTTTWGDETILAPTPRDQRSTLYSPSWTSSTRITTAQQPVDPGEQGIFSFMIEPLQEGLIRQTFNLVAEGVAEGQDLWFSDSGGPNDEYLEIKVEAQICDEILEGEIQRITCDGIEGWALDRAVLNRYPRVELLVVDDGVLNQSVVIADLTSIDPQCMGEECSHYFDVPWPSHLNPEQITVDHLSMVIHGFNGQTLTLSSQHLSNECNAPPTSGSEIMPEGGLEAGSTAGLMSGEESGVMIPTAGEQAGTMNTDPRAGMDEVGMNDAGTNILAGREEVAGSDSVEIQRLRSSDDGCTQYKTQTPRWIFVLLTALVWRRRENLFRSFCIHWRSSN